MVTKGTREAVLNVFQKLGNFCFLQTLGYREEALANISQELTHKVTSYGYRNGQGTVCRYIQICQLLGIFKM